MLRRFILHITARAYHVWNTRSEIRSDVTAKTPPPLLGGYIYPICRRGTAADVCQDGETRANSTPRTPISRQNVRWFAVCDNSLGTSFRTWIDCFRLSGKSSTLAGVVRRALHPRGSYPESTQLGQTICNRSPIRVDWEKPAFLLKETCRRRFGSRMRIVRYSR